MRSWLAILVALVIGAAAIFFVVSRFVRPADDPATSLRSDQASYLGVFESGPPHTYQPVADFAAATGAEPNLVGYYGGWREPFQAAFAETIRQHGAATILQWDPTNVSISLIAAGGFDSYLRSFARSVRDFGSPVIIGFGHEMNAPWYSWGFNGSVPPSTFVAAWRHIVTLFRGEGADNVTWLWTLQADEPGTGPIASWWPGAQYVTWVGIDGYYYRPSDTFASVFGKTIAQVRSFTTRPVLLSETAVGPEAGQSHKLPDLFAGMRHYDTLGLVWFDIAQDDGIYHQDWHIEDAPAAEAAFRQAASTMTLVHP
jgi:glycosyl hydrolase family 26